jgi:hypothetical protein
MRGVPVAAGPPATKRQCTARLGAGQRPTVDRSLVTVDLPSVVQRNHPHRLSSATATTRSGRHASGGALAYRWLSTANCSKSAAVRSAHGRRDGAGCVRPHADSPQCCRRAGNTALPSRSARAHAVRRATTRHRHLRRHGRRGAERRHVCHVSHRIGCK